MVAAISPAPLPQEDMRARNPRVWPARPQPPPDNWLYLNGHAVVCRSPHMTVSALVSAINPSVGTTTSCGSS